MMDDDEILARQLQEEYDREAAEHLEQDSNLSDQLNIKNLRGSGTRRGVPDLSQRSVGISPVDPSLEFTDPNPDIRLLFLQFNEDYFYGKLLGIEVKWSPRMTLCAGVCVYEGNGGLCSVRLSQPLLKLRPRKDLVETLLHEMIHAYLFITDHDRDRDGHGPNFQKHMHRINKATGANITIYHNFHDEVSSYQQHWWRCNGPCQHRKPFFGYVRRAMNRAPSANDFWWAEHQATCGGTYTKIKEPDDYGKKRAGAKKEQEKTNGVDMRKFLDKKQNVPPPTTTSSKSVHTLFGSIGTSNKVPSQGNSGQRGSVFSKGKSNGKVPIKKNISSSASSVIVGGVIIPKSSLKQSSLFTSINQSNSHIPQSNPGTSPPAVSSRKKPIPHSSSEQVVQRQKKIEDVLQNMSHSKGTVREEDTDFRGREKNKFKHQGNDNATTSQCHKKNIHKFPSGFVSVCEGGRGGLGSKNFFSPKDIKKGKKKIKKRRYILDELDNDEGLWDIDNQSDLKEDLNKPSTSAKRALPVSPLNKQLKDVCKLPEGKSLVKKKILKEKSPRKSDAYEHPSTDYHTQTNIQSQLFPGNGYRLGHEQTTELSFVKHTQEFSQSSSSFKTKSRTEHENSSSLYCHEKKAVPEQKTKRSFDKAFFSEVINISDDEYEEASQWHSSKKIKEECVYISGTADNNDRDGMATDECVSTHSSSISDSEMGTGANVSASTNTSESSENKVSCPVCSVSIRQDSINSHLDICLGIT